MTSVELTNQCVLTTDFVTLLVMICHLILRHYIFSVHQDECGNSIYVGGKAQYTSR